VLMTVRSPGGNLSCRAERRSSSHAGLLVRSPPQTRDQICARQSPVRPSIASRMMSR
jgi:hypothetical protein